MRGGSNIPGACWDRSGRGSHGKRRGISPGIFSRNCNIRMRILRQRSRTSYGRVCQISMNAALCEASVPTVTASTTQDRTSASVSPASDRLETAQDA